MDKEKGEAERGDKGQSEAGSLLDAASSIFAYWPRGETTSVGSGSATAGAHSLFSGIPGGFANHLAGHPLPGAFSMMGGRGGSGGGYGAPHHPPTTAPGTYGGLGTLSVAASQAASLGINPASAAWWTMASHLAAQDYLARLQASGMSFGGLTGTESLLPGYPLLTTPHSQPHVSSSKMSGGKSGGGPKAGGGGGVLSTTSSSLLPSSTPSLAASSPSLHHRERERDRERERERDKERERDRMERERERERETQVPASAGSLGLHPPSIISDPASILGGVRLPPDTEIIKYTSSIIGPKIPGTTNRGRKKTISLDPPSVSVMPTHSSTGMLIERGGRKHSRSRLVADQLDYREGDRDRVEVIKLPAHSNNGTIPLNIPSFGGGYGGGSPGAPDSDAPLNLSLKPQPPFAPAGPHQSPALSSLSSMSAALAPAAPDRISRRKPGPKPRRVIQSPAPTSIPASPSPSLVQLFAAADSPSPRPSSGGEDSEPSPKDGRPRNLGRGTSKPKKNTVASLLAQSRALGIKPTAGLDVSSSNHQVSLLKPSLSGSEPESEQDQRCEDDEDDELPRLRREDLPQPRRDEEPQPRQDEEPQPRRDEEPQPRRDEEPQPRRDEEPQPRRDEEPQPRRDEEPQPRRDEDPQPRRDEDRDRDEDEDEDGEEVRQGSQRSECGEQPLLEDQREVSEEQPLALDQPPRDSPPVLTPPPPPLPPPPPPPSQVEPSAPMDSECESNDAPPCERGHKPPSPATPSSDQDHVSNKQKRHLVSSRSEDNKLKIRAVEGLSEDSSMADVSTDSGSGSDGAVSDSEADASSTPRKEEQDKCGGPTPKRRKLEKDLCDLRIPLEHGWRRETLIGGVSRTGTIKGDVSYFSPCGRRIRQFPDIVRYLEKNNVFNLSRENFSFSPKVVLGEFLQPTGGEEPVRLSEEQVAKRLEDLRTCKAKSHASNAHKLEAARIAQEQKLQQQLEREKAAMMAKEARRAAKEEAARQKEHVRLLKEQERNERQEAIRKERELRNQQLMEGRKRLAFTLEQKMHIIREIEKGKSKSDVSRELGLASSTVATIWKNRDSVISAFESNGPKTEAVAVATQAQASSITGGDDDDLAETARRKRQEELEKQRQEEQLRKQQERELKRQQAALIKEQLYMQELNKQREMLYTVELERERRRQHIMLVKVLDGRKRLEERERKRQELRAEKLATKERRMEQRRIELELVKELRKPVEDMELTDHKPLPTLNRIPGLKLSGQAFADTLMVFEFLHNFGETLGFDMDSLPTLNSLQMALLSDEESEEELLSVMTHLLVCAIEDPGIPNPARHTTILGQSLKQADITHANLSEILRIYLYANATGEVKALTGLHFERDREKKSDHHNNFGETAAPCGKNAAFFEHLRGNPTWRMSEWLNERPFMALNPTHKAAILAFLCNELLQNKAVIRQIDASIDTVGQLRRDRWLMDTKLRKLRVLHSRKVRQPTMQPLKAGSSPCEEPGDLGLDGKAVKPEGEDADDEDGEEDDPESGNESDGTQPEEEEDRNLSAEELHRKIERLSRQCDNSLHALSTSSQQLRAVCFGQDRYWRRYWSLPCAGGVFVEAMESAEPEVFEVERSAAAPASRLGEGEPGPDAREGDDRRAPGAVYEEGRSCEGTEAAGDESDGDETRNEHRKTRTREKVRDEEPAERSPVEAATSEDCVEVKTEPEADDAGGEGGDGECAAGERTATVKDEGCGTATRTPSDHSLSFLLDKKMDDTRFTNNAAESQAKDDGLSAVKVEIKSDLFGAELNAHGMEDKFVDCREKTLVFAGKTSAEEVDSKVPTAFLVHKPLQFERLGECMEKAGTVELGSVLIPNGDKFNSLSHVCSASMFNNGKELNGGFLLGSMANVSQTERNWFSILPRDSCDLTSLTSVSTARLLEGAPGLELRIPVFPPPSRLSSPSPASSQCESPAPLVLTAEEMVQLEQMKRCGPPPEPAQARPVPLELQRGWWRITDEDQLRTIVGHLHSRGVRERELKRVMSKHVDSSAVKVCLAGDKAATDLAITPMDSKVSQLPGGAPLVDSRASWFSDVALRVDLATLEQVEALEDKVANASMQVKGWKVPGRVTAEEGAVFRPSCTPCCGDDDARLDPVSVAKERLLSLEAAIERRYLRPPLGVSTGDVNLSGVSGEGTTPDDVPKGLAVWRDAVCRAHTSAQVAMALCMLEASTAWDKSIMKANCQFCHSGDNEDKLLLCDGCDKGYHTYCFRPKMDNIPDGDWYCYECMNKATGERNCIVCGKKSGKNLATCDMCPRAYHADCLQPSLPKVPRGKWFCPTCQSKQPRKRNSGRRSASHGKSHRESESSDIALSTPPATPGGCPAGDDAASLASAPSPPSTPGKKERERSKKLAKDLNPCRVVLEELERHDEAWPFLLPVNTKQFPTYRKIIRSPMDLSTIKRRLQDCLYKSREEFCADVRLIFNNCETFNEDDSPVGKAGHNMRMFFEMRWNEVCGSHPKPGTPP